MTRNRNYPREYQRNHSSQSAKRRRAARNAARRRMLKAGRVKKGDKKDVHHKDRNPQNNSASNISVVSRSKNRSVGESPGRPSRKG